MGEKVIMGMEQVDVLVINGRIILRQTDGVEDIPSEIHLTPSQAQIVSEGIMTAKRAVIDSGD